jgi:hypothetical protein
VRGVHLRYLVDDVRAIKGVGVFQQGSVAFVPSHMAVPLVASGDFEVVTEGPLARVFVVRIGQDKLPSAEVGPPTRVGPEPIDFELELEEEERRFALAAPTDDSEGRDPR